MGLTVAVVGATGAVGEELLKVLHERRFPVDSLKPLASPRSAGKTVVFAGREITVLGAEPSSFAGVDIAFFSAGASVSKELAKEAVARGAVVIDNTSAFRLEPDVPLVVPEVNPEDISGHKGIIANPNCSTIIMVVALAPLHRKAGLKRVIASTYQAVSGAGARAMAELTKQTRAVLEGRAEEATVLPVQKAARHFPIAFNLIPQIDVFGEADYTREEWKMVHETRKILHEPNLGVTATCVRVPVYRSHSESLNIETGVRLSVGQVREILAEAPGVIVQDEPESQEYPMPLMVAGRDEVFVGRIREDLSHPSGLALWVVGDQLRKGAALNAVQIAEFLIQG